MVVKWESLEKSKMKTRWGCRRSCWSQGKVDWPAASHVLIKRLTARTMLMFRNDLVSTWGPTFSRSIFPFPFRNNDETESAPYFQAPPRVSYRSLLSATPRLCSYEPLISTVIPPNLPLWENVLPPFFDGTKRWLGKSFHPLFNGTRNSSFLEQHSFHERCKEFREPRLLFLFIFYIQRRHDDLTKLRGGAPQKSRPLNNPGQEWLRASTSLC